jgi:hypothetical protein
MDMVMHEKIELINLETCLNVFKFTHIKISLIILLREVLLFEDHYKFSQWG